MISETKRKSIEERMQRLQIFERDLEEHFIRSGGAGGQNVNKVSTCVYLKHLPSSLEVKCQKTRSQVDNRYFARVILCDKLDQRIHGAKSEMERERYRIQKQKKKRSRRAKQKMTQEKRDQSAKKSARKVDHRDWD